MFEVIRVSGPWGILLSILILLNIGLVAWSLSRLVGSKGKVGSALKNPINAILFWGATGAVVGVLGQVTGVYLALNAIRRATEISPAVIMEGAAISFIPTITGLLFLLCSGSSSR